MAKEMIRIPGLWDRMEIAMAKSQLTKDQIAMLTGVDRKVLYAQPLKQAPSTRTLFHFCRVTHTSADWLLGLRDYER